MKKIMIVDDDEKVTTMLKRFLSSKGYQITATNESSQAVQTANEASPDLFILDIMMPPPDGFTLCKMLRTDPKFSRTPILIITAFEISNSKAATVGADGYLAKPFDLDELASKLDELLRG